jgi:hypothetical protein
VHGQDGQQLDHMREDRRISRVVLFKFEEKLIVEGRRLRELSYSVSKLEKGLCHLAVLNRISKHRR